MSEPRHKKASMISGNPANWTTWIIRALTFLVISCPCALVISIPLSFFGGLGGASKAGILVKGSTYLEQLAKTEIVVMDKTGTLTKGNFAVKEIHSLSEEISQDTLLEVTAMVEYYSNHPISVSIKNRYGKEIDAGRLESAEEIAGFGVKAVVDGTTYHVGNDKLMRQIGIDVPEQ